MSKLTRVNLYESSYGETEIEFTTLSGSDLVIFDEISYAKLEAAIVERWLEKKGEKV